MSRTNVDLVKAVLLPGKDYDLARAPDLAPFMRVGQRKVDALVLACQAKKVAVPDSDTLQDLETWVSAWAYKNSDQQQQSGNSGRSSGSFTGQTETGLMSNYYGQTAVALDPTGLLDFKVAPKTAGAAWVGKPPTSQIPYRSRD